MLDREFVVTLKVPGTTQPIAGVIAECIASDATCAQGEYQERVQQIRAHLSVIDRLETALDIARTALLKIERECKERRAEITRRAQL